MIVVVAVPQGQVLCIVSALGLGPGRGRWGVYTTRGTGCRQGCCPPGWRRQRLALPCIALLVLCSIQEVISVSSDSFRGRYPGRFWLAGWDGIPVGDGGVVARHELFWTRYGDRGGLTADSSGPSGIAQRVLLPS